MKFKLGKLYRCPEYFLMIYPTKETARVSAHQAEVVGSEKPVSLGKRAEREVVRYWARSWSIALDRQIYYSEPNEVFMFLKKDGIYLNVLFGEKVGWIVYGDWLNVAEAQNEI